MTDQEQIIALAEWDGWEDQGWYCPNCKTTVHGARVTYDERHDPADGGCGCKVLDSTPKPDYLHDLNAVYELEKKLTGDQVWHYCCELGSITGAGGDPEFVAAEWSEVHATSRQRCEALLRTIGKWKD